MPRHPLMRRLLRLCGLPLAAPSANPFGYISPTTAGHVRDGLGDKISFILDGGPTSIGLESTILDLRDPRRPQLLRPGAVSRSGIERVLGCKLRRPVRAGAGNNAALPSPGLMKRHYSPHTPLVLHKKISVKQAQNGKPGEAWLFFSRPCNPTGQNVFWFDSRGNLPRAGRRLFGLLRALDRRGFNKIHAELASGGQLAEAINDRLHRAAGLKPKA
jgi:L-threonylcarbamoyladenylate synthase